MKIRVICSIFQACGTHAQLECDLLVKTPNNFITIEIKIGSRLEKRWLLSLKQVMQDTGANKAVLCYGADQAFEAEKNIWVTPTFADIFWKHILEE